MGSEEGDGHGAVSKQARKGGRELKAEPVNLTERSKTRTKGGGGAKGKKNGYVSFPKEEQWGVKSSRAGFAEAPLASCPSCSEAGEGRQHSGENFRRARRRW